MISVPFRLVIIKSDGHWTLPSSNEALTIWEKKWKPQKMKMKNQVLNWNLRAVNLGAQISVESTKLCCASKGLLGPYKGKRRVVQIIYQELTNSSCPLCVWTNSQHTTILRKREGLLKFLTVATTAKMESLMSPFSHTCHVVCLNHTISPIKWFPFTEEIRKWKKVENGEDNYGKTSF